MGTLPPWGEALGLGMDASSPHLGLPMGGMGGYSGGFADIAMHATQIAPALDREVTHLHARVQKLERSRGQILKDLSDMLGECRDLRRRTGSEDEQKKDLLVGEPPGLSRRASRTKTAPALGGALPSVVEEQHVLDRSNTDQIFPPGLALPVSDSITVQAKELDGVRISRVEWRIDNAKTKFKDCVGRHLVSPQFEAAGLTELRLMVTPDLGLDVRGLTIREQKSKYEERISEGPLRGTVKFKVVTSISDKLIINFNLFVGELAQGPLEHDFAEHIIHGVEFNSNWLDHMKGGSVVVGVEILTVQGFGLELLWFIPSPSSKFLYSPGAGGARKQRHRRSSFPMQ